MSKIINYITNGRGIGLGILLSFTLIISVFYIMTFKSIAEESYIPAIQNVAEEFLPIRVENGVIVEPEATQKTYNVPYYNFPIVLDTSVSDFDIDNMQSGIYISNNKVYLVNKNFNKIYKLKDSYYIPQDDYREKMSIIMGQMTIPVILYFFVVLSVFFLLAILIYCGISYIISHIFKINFSFGQRMRLSTLCYITTYLTLFLLEIVVGYTSSLIFFVAMIMLQILFFKDLTLKKD